LAIDSGTEVTTIFQVAVEAASASISHRRWSGPSMVLSGPSRCRFALRYWRVSSTKISARRPQRKRR
jgi:hypothetical protein